MQIQKINPKFYYTNYSNNLKNNIKTENNKTTSNSELVTNPILNINFEARVDKGLTRFYEANAKRMPKTVKKFIETHTDKSSFTPLEAQAAAFAALAGIGTVAGIKEAFPDEELFMDLKEVHETKATRGLLNTYRQNKELLNVCEESILENKENFTVWLVKEIFLKGRTLEEINQDFNSEVNKEFRDLHDIKEANDNEPIKSSTIKALGIQMPDSDYMQSLRYTREGYSDLVGEKISQSLKAFIESLPIEQRTARARVSCQKFENWWASLGKDKQLQMIAEDNNELQLLENFNHSDYGKTRSKKKNDSESINKNLEQNKTKIKVESELSRDDLFKIWASNKLKLYRANLTEYDKKIIDNKRDQKRIEWWNSMSDVERTEYIEKLRKSHEPSRYAMIDAWNNNPDILIELSHTLKKHNFNKPVDILYGTEDFNTYLSQVMTDFWASHPDFTKRMGESIKNSHEKVKESMSAGRFELLKGDILKARSRREKETAEAIKNYRETLPEEVYDLFPDYVQSFIDAYSNSPYVDVQALPPNYIREYYTLLLTDLNMEQVLSWTKAIKQEPLTEEDRINLSQISHSESDKAYKMNRALEATLATVLYECTSNPDVYLMSHADCKLAIKQIRDGKENITITSERAGRSFNIPILKRDINFKKIDALYDYYTNPISNDEAEAIVDQFFLVKPEYSKTMKEQMEIENLIKDFISLYGRSIEIAFDTSNNKTPLERANFIHKFLRDMPIMVNPEFFTLNARTISDFKREEEIVKINNKISKKYDFISKEVLWLYLYELDKVLRITDPTSREDFEEFCCKPKKSVDDSGKSIILSRSFFRPSHKIFGLTFEQALADVVYEATGEEKVYALRFEELLDNIESFMLVKKFPSKQEWKIKSDLLNETFSVKLKHRIQPYKIEKRVKEYVNEITKYIKNCYNDNEEQLDFEEILYILNPEENKENIDKYTNLRIQEIASYFNS